MPPKRGPSGKARADADQSTVREFYRGQAIEAHAAWHTRSGSAREAAGAKPAAAGRAADSSSSVARAISSSTFGRRVLSVLRAAFLPEGYPESVSGDYLGRVAWGQSRPRSACMQERMHSRCGLYQCM